MENVKNQEQNEIPEYLLIKNPYNDTRVNVLPFLKYLSNNLGKGGFGSETIVILQDALDWIQQQEFEAEDIKFRRAIIMRLIVLRKCFEEILKGV